MKLKHSGILISGIAFMLMCEARSEDMKDLCPEKISQIQSEGKTYIPVCNQSYMGKALTADFHPIVTHALTDTVSQIRDFTPVTDGNYEPQRFYQKSLEKFYGVRNMKYVSTIPNPAILKPDTSGPEAGRPETGSSLLSKFSTAVVNSTGDAASSDFIRTTLTDANSVHAGNQSTAAGSCMIWSAWSMDPEVKKLFEQVNDGILCSGVPFTRGELKELVTAVYPDPYKNHNLDQHALAGYYHPISAPFNDPTYSTNQSTVVIEDANLALAKLGGFGEGSGFKPDNLIQMAEAAKAKNYSMIMDLDPGTRDVWNQPMEAIVDVPYLDNSLNGADIASFLKSDDLVAAGTGGAEAQRELKLAEESLKYSALRGDQNVSSDLKRLRATAQDSGSYPQRMPLMDQVAELKRLQQKLIDSHVVQVSANAVVKHRIFVQYGQEGPYGQNAEMPSKTRELDYVSVNGRANWMPPTRKLSEVCADGHVGTRVMMPRYYGLVAENLASECATFANNHVDREIAAGAFPPKEIDIYTNPQGDARFSGEEQQKRVAYNHLKDMILNCDRDKSGSFHGAAVFMDHLKNAISTNALSTNPSDPNSVPSLKREYDGVKDFLDDASLPASQNFVKSTIIDAAKSAGGDASKFQNLKALYSSLFP